MSKVDERTCRWEWAWRAILDALPDDSIEGVWLHLQSRMVSGYKVRCLAVPALPVTQMELRDGIRMVGREYAFLMFADDLVNRAMVNPIYAENPWDVLAAGPDKYFKQLVEWTLLAVEVKT